MKTQSPRGRILPVLLFCVLAPGAAAQSSFVNWESPHVHPLDMTPDGTRLLAVNTPDGRLEVFDATGAKLALVASIPVGVDPVSVRARTNTEAWVVNHVSDSVSIVDLVAGNVVHTLRTHDEPADVVFAGAPPRAFVSCSQTNEVMVFDPASPQSAPLVVPIVGEDPRAMAVSADGTRVYVAVFESGNRSTILGGGALAGNFFPRNVVSDINGPYAGQNPPPNSGTSFVPPIDGALPAPPKVGLIVKKDALGRWMDDNAHDWTNKVSGADAAHSNRVVGWDLADHDVAVLDASNPTSVTYAKGLMNLCMALAVNPSSGRIAVVGTEATNEVRFEPIVRGKFLRVRMAGVDASGPTPVSTGHVDLNPHLDYSTATLAQSERDKSIGDPRAIAWNAAGTRAWIAGMGSNNVIIVDAAGARAGAAPAIEVPEGPTGIVVDDARARVYVLSRFAASVTTIAIPSESVVGTIGFHDASPGAIRSGRRFLYDTHATSGLGQIACGSCHVDARMDGLAWDLGDPSGAMRPVAGNNLAAGIPQLSTGFEDFHPMKGPMTTQSLQDIIGLEPLHWRGDRTGIEDFNPAYVGLQGDDAQLSAIEMQQFEDYLATITYPPNPFRNFDNTLPASLPLPGHLTTGRFGPAGLPMPNGNAQTGLSNHRTLALDAGALRCVTCHTLPTGAGTDYRLVGATFQPIAPGPNGERHLALVAQDGSTNVSMKIPQLRNQYEKTGFNMLKLVNTRGFGYLHDGSVDTVERFLAEPVFAVTSEQQIANLVAFMMAFSGSELPQGSINPAAQEPPGPPGRDTHAAVGWQTTLRDVANPLTGQLTLINDMITQANAQKVGVIAQGLRNGLARGAYYSGAGIWQTDRAAETFTTAQIQSAAVPGSEITFTVVPRGSQVRLGADRDLDGWLDRDELDLGSDPADASRFPGSAGWAYCLGDGSGTACPCGNASPMGDASGCASSLGVGGKLTASGTASITFDTLVLTGSQMPNSFALYFQGTAQTAGGAGAAFGDGLRCASGSVVRLSIRANLAGSSQYPSAGDASVSSRGQVTLPGSRAYQVWYRNAAAFCSADTFNLTNGWKTVWAP